MSDSLHARRLGSDDRSAVLAYLGRASEDNLHLIDLAARLGEGLVPGEIPPELIGVFEGEVLEAVASLRPSIALSEGMSEAARRVLQPYLLRVPSGLVKSDRRLVEPLWEALAAAGRVAVINRVEIAYRLRPESIVPAAIDLPGIARPARPEDLEELVYAARASLREEDRPDPAEGDPLGFQRWVRGRLPRARIVSEAERVVFVGYADVRRSAGWLVQGVYTWPEARRKGFARRGMDSIVREAFASGARHVQLAVVAGNQRASRLYEALGFEAFGELRTVLFH